MSLNRFTSDTDEEIELIMHHCEQKGIRCVVNNAYTDGGIGAADLANAVVEEIENNPSRPLRCGRGRIQSKSLEEAETN